MLICEHVVTLKHTLSNGQSRKGGGFGRPSIAFTVRRLMCMEVGVMA